MQTKKNIIISKVKEAVYEFDKKSEVILFGSRAREDYNDESDWDFAAFANIDVNEKIRQELTYKIFNIELETENAISVFFYSFKDKKKYAETIFFRNINEEGIKI